MEKEDKNKNKEEEEDYDTEDKKIDPTVKIPSKLPNKKLIVIIEQCSLELSKSKKYPEIINGDDHIKIIKNMKRSPEDFRPDITHQCLLSLFDSPLNKVGLLQVFIRTVNNILIEINPKTRIPRTYKRFSGLFAQLLIKNKIKASDSNDILLKVVNGTIKEHIKKEIPIIFLTEKGRLVDIDSYAESLTKSDNKNVCVVIGANAKGDINKLIDYANDSVSISSYDLTSSVVCAKICTSFEKIWDIL